MFVPGKTPKKREVGVVVIHVLESSCRSSFSKVDEFVGAIAPSDNHKATTTDAAMIHA